MDRLQAADRGALMVFLVHHADAVAPSVDSQRPLSVSGRMHARRVAADAAARGVKPAVIWHSGKLRARQTAEELWRACNPFAELRAQTGLQPADPPSIVVDQLGGESREVMVVGHMPNLELVHELMLSRAGGVPRTAFPTHGLVAVERDASGWREAWRLV